MSDDSLDNDGNDVALTEDNDKINQDNDKINENNQDNNDNDNDDVEVIDKTKSGNGELRLSPSKYYFYSPDEPLTSDKELKGWYMYDFANSVYSSIAISVFIPLLLEDLAYKNGEVDGMKCPEYEALNNFNRSQVTNCEIPFGATGTVNNVSYPLYITSISVLVQAIVFISIGSFADFGNLRKKLLIVFSFIGSIGTILYFFTFDPSTYWIGGVLAIITNVSYGTSIVFYNAYLAVLVQQHPEMKKLEEAGHTKKHLVEEMDVLTNKISTYGFAAGYVSGVGLLLVSAAIILAMGDQTVYSYNISIGISGIWWLVFSLYTFKHLKTRPGPPLPAENSYILFSWKRVVNAFRHVREIPNTFAFLGAFFMFSDGYSTITAVSILFAKSEMGFVPSQLVVIAIIVPLCALFGNFIFMKIQNKYKMQTKHGLLLNLYLLACIPIYGMFGFTGVFGIVTPVELYLVAVFYGLLLGSVQSNARVLFTELVPEGCEAEFFSLFEITDKGSSWLGPLITGIISSGASIRYSFIYILAFIVIPIPIIRSLNVPKGIEDAKLFAKKKMASLSQEV